MAAATRHLGLGATLSTSFHSAYHLARWLASLDVMSKGRVAWNVVTSATDLEARNAGLDELPPRELRYDRADEVLEACFALWNSWEDNAFVLDKKQGVLADPVEGALRQLRGPVDQDARAALHPAQPAGPSRHHAGRQLRPRPRVRRALGRGDLHHPARQGRDARVLRRHQDAHGRRAAASPAECAILPSVSVVLGETESIARERADYLDSLIDPELNRAATSSNLGADITKLKEGVTLASLQGNQGMKGSEDVLKQHMKAQGLTFAQVAENRGRSASWSARPRWWPTACRRSSSRARATASSSRRSIIRACSSSSAAASCPSCSAAACFARSTPAGRCARI